MLAPAGNAGDTELALAAVLDTVAVIVSTTWLSMYPFLALDESSPALGMLGGLPFTDTMAGLQSRVGDTVGSMGLLVALGRGGVPQGCARLDRDPGGGVNAPHI